MKKLIIILLLLSFHSCVAQDTLVSPRKVGFAIGEVTQVTSDSIATFKTDSGKTLEIYDSKGLKKYRGYDVIYYILDGSKSNIVKVELIKYRTSDQQNKEDRAELYKQLISLRKDDN